MEKLKPFFNFQNLFAFVIFSLVYAHFYKHIDPTVNETYKNILLIITGFVFGSSKSSVSKDTKIDELQKTATALALTAKSPDDTTKTEVINTENISGDVKADVINTNTTDAKPEES